MPTYSLSSAAGRQAGSTNAKRVSAQLGRLMGSRSRLSAEQSRRGISDDGRAISTCSANNRMSKAAAWMWHTRGIGDAHAAVVPTKQLLAGVNAGNNVLNSCRRLGSADGVARTRPSRFKQEAASIRGQAAATMSSVLAHGSSSLEGNTQHRAEDLRPSPTLANELLYDDFELSHLQKLLDQTEIDKPDFKFSARAPSPGCPSVSSALTSPSRQTKLFSSIHKLLKRLYTTVHSTHSHINSAIETPRPASTRLSVLGPHKLSSVKHVIHHHHHHYHHYRSSLDLPVQYDDAASPYEPLHLQGFVRRRRHSFQSCNQEQRLIQGMVELDHLVDDDSHYTKPSVHHLPQRPRAPMTAHIGLATRNDDKVEKRW